MLFSNLVLRTNMGIRFKVLLRRVWHRERLNDLSKVIQCMNFIGFKFKPLTPELMLLITMIELSLCFRVCQPAITP